MRIEPEQRNPMRAHLVWHRTSVADALRRGCHKMIIGLGWQCHKRCSIGMLRALIETFAPEGNFKDIHLDLTVVKSYWQAM